MDGDNATGADNQQETAIPRTRLEPAWVVGFVDGEGCLSVSVHNNPYVRRTRGWQLHPVFQVYQHDSIETCSKSSWASSAAARFAARARAAACRPSRSTGCDNWERTSSRSSSSTSSASSRPTSISSTRSSGPCSGRSTFAPAGFERLARLAYAMNANGKQRARTIEEVLAGSSETVRQALF